MNKKIKALFYSFVFLFFSQPTVQAQSNLHSRSYFSMGSSAGLPAGFNIVSACHFTKYDFRLSGLYIGMDADNNLLLNGIELALMRTIKESLIGWNVAFMVGYSKRKHDEENHSFYYGGIGYGLRYRGGFALVGLAHLFNLNRITAESPVYPILQLGYLFDL